MNDHKKCTCCGNTHYTLDQLTFIGENVIGPHYNCICGSTLIVPVDLVENLRAQAKEEARRLERGEEAFYKDHVKWGSSKCLTY